jgi:hypothetical protein
MMEMREQKLRYSEWKMHLSGMPRLIFQPTCEPTDTYCGMACVDALQSAGFIPNQPAELTTASDLYILAMKHMNGYIEPYTMRHGGVTGDATSYTLSSEYRFEELYRSLVTPEENV